MKIYCLTVFILFLSPLSLLGQNLQLDWVRVASGGLADGAIATSTDASGNVYTVGSFEVTVNIDAGPGVYTMTSLDTLDMYVTKHNANGVLVWARHIGMHHWDGNNDGPLSMVADAAGNVYITGLFADTVDFDPGPGVMNLVCTSTWFNAFLLKLDSNGNFAWAKNIAQADYISIGYSVSLAASGNIYVTGTFIGLTDFDPGPGVYNVNSTSLYAYIFISKFDNGGNFIWSKQFSGTNSQVSYAITTDAQENIYTTGYFIDTADFDPGPSVHNLVADIGPDPWDHPWTDAFVTKLDANGNFVWAKQFAGIDDQEGVAITIDPGGNVVVTGNFQGDTDFDPGPAVFMLTDANADVDPRTFVVKLNSNGDFLWADDVGGTSAWVVPYSIACDAQGYIYFAGEYGHTVDFDPGTSVYELSTPGTWSNPFICKLQPDGSFDFAKSLTGTSWGLASCLTVDPAKNVYVCGWFAGTYDFDPGPGTYLLTSTNNWNGFVLKLSQCLQPTSETIFVTACTEYTLNGQTYTSSGTYTQQLLNVAGCDSSLTLHLTIGGSTTISNVTACDAYVWEGQTYVNSGTYTVTFTGADGCDSIRKLNLIIGQSVATNINVSICAGTSYQGYTSSGTYTDTLIGSSGCDSVRTLHLTLKPTSQETFTITICEGESYWNHSATGIYLDTLTAVNGCDSIRTLNLQVNPVKRTNTNASICRGETYYVGGANQSNSGIYADTLISYLGCDSIITTALTVHELPVPDLGIDRGLCTGSTMLLNPGSFVTYEWQDQSTNPTFTAGAVGIYWVKVKDIYGCEATDSLVIATLLPLPANFLKPVDTICQYEKLQLTPVGNYNSYTWSDGSHQSTLTVQQPGQYILEVRDYNGCNGSDTTDVFAKTCRTGVFVPSAFTPNGDQKNDEFKAIVFGNVISFKLEVYNRWGQMVFSTTDQYKGWNGKVKGVEVNTAVFVWRCRYQLEGEKPVEEKGVVTLIR